MNQDSIRSAKKATEEDRATAAAFIGYSTYEEAERLNHRVPEIAEAIAFARGRQSVANLGGFRPMEEWDRRDEAVLLMVDYGDGGDHAIDDATVALTIGHNNDHNVGDDEGEGWKFAGWCWSHDHYTEGKGKPIGWMPLPHHLARAIEDARDQTA